MTEEQGLLLQAVSRAEAGWRYHAKQAEQQREQRNALILEALSAGLTHAEIAGVTGLSRGRIGQLAQASRGLQQR